MNNSVSVEPKHYRGAGGILSNKLQSQPNERDRSLQHALAANGGMLGAVLPDGQIADNSH